MPRLAPDPGDSHHIVGWSMTDIQERHLVIKAVPMACWQRPDREPLVLHSERGTQFTSALITTSPAA